MIFVSTISKNYKLIFLSTVLQRGEDQKHFQAKILSESKNEKIMDQLKAHDRKMGKLIQGASNVNEKMENDYGKLHQW